MERPRCLWLAALVAGCVPQTDLGSSTAGADAGATAQAVVLVEPAPGGIAPQNLAAVVLRAPSPLRDASGAVQLRPAGGAAVMLGAAAVVDCTGSGRCYAFTLAAPVPPGHYQVAAMGAFFEDGRPVPASPAGAFSVEAGTDATPPVVDPPLVETVGDCLRVRFATDEPARASLVVRAGGEEQVLAAGEASTLFDVATRLGRLPPGVPAELVVRAVDWAGNRGESGPLPISTPPASLPVAITEVLPNPTGPEATQEFVELRNLGSVPIDLGGMLIEDGSGGDPLPPAVLAPGAFAVVVAELYNPMEGRDPAPRADALLLRVAGRLGKDGLSNAGEAVRLRAASGEVLSRYGGWVDTGPSAWTGHSVQRLPQDACDAPAAWNPRPAPPTPGW